MLAEFQQACADLVASPALVAQARVDPGPVLRRYDLTALEQQRLVAFANNPGIEATCMLYRANRVAPLALNLKALCSALGPQLRPLLDAYWTSYPNTDVHFLAECKRFCTYLEGLVAEGYALPPDAMRRLAADVAVLDMRLEASYTESPPT